MRRIATGLAVAAMFFAACGSSSKPSSSGANSSSTTAGGSSGGGSSNTTAKSSNNNSGGGDSDVTKANIKVTFKEAGADASSSSTLTFAQNGKGKTSFSSQDASNASTPLSTIYLDGSAIVECEGTGSTAKCTSVPGAQASIVTGVTQAFAALAAVAKSTSGADKSSDSIAGRDVKCYKFKAQSIISKLIRNPIFQNSNEKVSDYDASDTATICLDKKTDFPLKFAGTKKGVAESNLTATAVSDPSDSDFTPPATPQTVPVTAAP